MPGMRLRADADHLHSNIVFATVTNDGGEDQLERRHSHSSSQPQPSRRDFLKNITQHTTTIFGCSLPLR
jgi:hypothetical protein